MVVLDDCYSVKMEGNLILQIILIFLPVLAVVAIFAVGFSWYIARTSMVPTRTIMGI